MKLNILIDEEEKKFYTMVEDRECHLCYEILPDNVIKLTSTYVPQSIRTKGIAWELAEFAFDYAKKNNMKVIPRCGFIRRFVDKNPKFKELLKDKDSYI